MPAGLRARVNALSVPASQLALAVSGYLLLVAAGRALPVAAFAAVGAFSMLLNTVARGVFSAAELELTRAVSAARADGDPGRRAAAALARRVLGLLAATLLLLGATSPLLLAAVGNDPATLAWLFVSAVTVATAHVVRGPLAAMGRFRAYSATYAAEAVFGVVGATVLLILGDHRPAAWCAALALAPLLAVLTVAPIVVGAPLRRQMMRDLRTSQAPGTVAGAPTTAGLLWSVVLFLSLQGLWNLAAVVVTARAQQPEVAGGFAAVSILLRTPFLAAPAIQVLLLPSVTTEAARGERGLLVAVLRRYSTAITVALAAWMLGALLLIRPLTRLLFGLAVLPNTTVVLELAAAPLLGVAAFVVQTQLVAHGLYRSVALSWLGGLLVLLAVAMAPVGDVEIVGGFAQLSAAVTVLVALLTVLRRNRSRRRGAAGTLRVPTSLGA